MKRDYIIKHGETIMNMNEERRNMIDQLLSHYTED